MKHLLSAGIAVAGILGCLHLQASTGDEGITEQQIYIGARAGYSYNQDSCEKTNTECDNKEIGYGIFAGYDFTPHVGLEASFNNIGDTEANYPNVKLTGEVKQFDLSLKLAYPLYENLNLYGKLGAAYWDAKVTGGATTLSDKGVSPLLGAGLELVISPQWKGRIEYQYIDQIGNDDMGFTNANFVGLSLIWNFPLRKSTPLPIPAPEIAPEPIVAPPAPEPVKEQRIVIDEKMGGSLFEFNKSEIRNTAAIAPVLRILKDDPSLLVSVVGHTDSVGSSEYNQRLSETRANVVAKYLHINGIALQRIKVFGMGEDHPVADNATDDGRAKNRRVEFLISNTHLMP